MEHKRKLFEVNLTHLITLIIGVVFGAGVFYGMTQSTLENLRQCSYSHEDGKVLEQQVKDLTNEVSDLRVTMKQWEQNFNSGKWKIIDPPIKNRSTRK